jgi:hypothetical protein
VAQAVKLPMLSGAASAVALFACFALTGLLVPLVLRKPLWIDAEFVVASWWLVWVIALTVILYRGHKVSDDHAMKSPRSWGLREKLRGWGWASDASDVGGWFLDSEACAVVALILLALPLLVLLIWALLEVAIPGIAFIAYILLRGQLANVANDKHGCQGRPLRAAAWGILWATLYTAPLAALVWFVHLMAQHVVQ